MLEFSYTYRSTFKLGRLLDHCKDQKIIDSRHAMKEALSQLGVASTLILDASVGYIMSKVDYVLMGAEGVVESGGIVNKVIKLVGDSFVLSASSCFQS